MEKKDLELQLLNKLFNCDLCNSKENNLLIEYKNISFLSDSQTVDLDLSKVKCSNCGLITNKYNIDEFLTEHYKHNYKLGLNASKSEPIIYKNNEKYTRSELVFEWIINILNKNNLNPKNFSNILEVGCGEGKLVETFRNKLNLNIDGIEPNINSVNLAKSKNLSVYNGTYYDIEKKYDLIISFAVLEHLNSPTDYFNILKSRLNENGFIITAIPCQNKESYDIYFQDHIHHFENIHLKKYAYKTGYEFIDYDDNNENFSGFSIYLFKKSSDIKSFSANDNIKIWKERLKKLNEFLNNKEEIIVFGIGQTFEFIKTYSNLKNTNILAGVEDNLARFDEFEFEIMDFNNYINKSYKQPVVLTFNPSNKHLEYFKSNNISFFNIYKGK